jgi:hypothetical protein
MVRGSVDDRERLDRSPSMYGQLRCEWVKCYWHVQSELLDEM